MKQKLQSGLTRSVAAVMRVIPIAIELSYLEKQPRRSRTRRWLQRASLPSEAIGTQGATALDAADSGKRLRSLSRSVAVI
jgi:hypothetical protein